MDIYVGNLAYEVRDEELQEAFSSFGEVESARVIMDRNTGRSRGFGFVKMPNHEEGQAAIDALNDSELQGRPVRVRQADERQPRSDGFKQGGFNRGENRGGGRGGFNRKGGGGDHRSRYR